MIFFNFSEIIYEIVIKLAFIQLLRIKIEAYVKLGYV